MLVFYDIETPDLVFVGSLAKLVASPHVSYPPPRVCSVLTYHGFWFAIYPPPPPLKILDQRYVTTHELEILVGVGSQKETAKS